MAPPQLDEFLMSSEAHLRQADPGVALLLHDAEEHVRLVEVAVLRVDHRGADDAAGLVLEHEQEATAGVEVGGAAEGGERAGQQVGDLGARLPPARDGVQSDVLGAAGIGVMRDVICGAR